MASSDKNIKYKKNKKSSNKKKQKKVITTSYSIIICNIILLILTIVGVIYNGLFLNKKITEINNILESYNDEMSFEDIAPHYVFLGDSITEQFELSKYFNGYSVVNSGKDGDQTENILKNMEERVYQYNPSTVFLMIGTNDVKDNKSVDYIFNNIKNIIEEIQINLPNTKIVVQSIVPSQENWGEYDKNDKRKEINELLYNEYKDSDVIYLDLYSILEDAEDGKLKDEYTNDGLHLNDKSYRIISKELKKYMTMEKDSN